MLESSLRVVLKGSHHINEMAIMWWDGGDTNLVITVQCINVCNQQVIHLKITQCYIVIIFQQSWGKRKADEVVKNIKLDLNSYNEGD